MNCPNGGESAAEKCLTAIDAVCGSQADLGYLACYLNWQLGSWERVSQRLEAWLAAGAQGENPYTPAIDYMQAQCMVGALTARLTEVRQKIARNIEKANAAVRASIIEFPTLRRDQ